MATLRRLSVSLKHALAPLTSSEKAPEPDDSSELVKEDPSLGFGAGYAQDLARPDPTKPGDRTFKLCARQALDKLVLQPTLRFEIGEGTPRIFIQMSGGWETSYKCQANRIYEMRVERIDRVCCLVLKEMLTGTTEKLKSARTAIENPIFTVSIPDDPLFTNVKLSNMR